MHGLLCNIFVSRWQFLTSLKFLVNGKHLIPYLYECISVQEVNVLYREYIIEIGVRCSHLLDLKKMKCKEFNIPVAVERT